MKFVVAHTGARRGYAVPAILEKAGMLERFYTDICADVGLGRVICSADKLGLRNPALQRLASRRLPSALIGKTKTFARPNLKHFLRGRHSDPVEALRANLRWQCELGESMAREGFGEAQWLHAFLDEFPTLMIAAKDRGLKVVSEIYILLSSDRLVREETRAFPGWETEGPDITEIIREEVGEHALLRRADMALCPSEAVCHDLVQNFGFRQEQTMIVPYGVSDAWFHVRNEPVRGRVLFAGTADLRKGIQYLALAAEKLAGGPAFGAPSIARPDGAGAAPVPSNARRSVSRFEFRVAGNVTSQVREQKLCRHLNFLGRVPRNQTAAEFAAADVFVLPSLAEGSAGVTYEALACGVPVITTAAAGSVVRDGIEGRIVPERDPVALAEAIREVVEDREKRERMAHAARERAREYTWEKYGERLVAALKSCA